MDTNNNEIDRKRQKHGQDNLQKSPDFHLPQNDVDNGDFLTLTLASFQNQLIAAAAAPPPLPPPQHVTFINPPPPHHHAPNAANPIRLRRARRNPSRAPREGKSATITPPYPWSGAVRATVRTLSYLRANRITAISGDVQCKKCEQKFKMAFNLEQKFGEISSFVAENKALMRHRAPKSWMSPALPKCGFCNQESSVRPVISEKKRTINWLFLLLGQMLGCCTLEQLKYFCKHTKNHRTGAKDRVLFLAYLGLCRQLDPNGPFDI